MCGASDTAHLSQTETLPPVADAFGSRYLPGMPRPPDRTGTRINLTIPPETVAAIDRMCEASGVGRATFIRELLIGMEHHILGMAEAVDLAKQNNVDAFARMAATLRQVGNDADQMALDLNRTHRAAMRKRKLELVK